LQNTAEKFVSFNEEKGIEIVNGASVGGLVHDFVATSEEEFEAFSEKIVNGGGGGM